MEVKITRSGWVFIVIFLILAVISALDLPGSFQAGLGVFAGSVMAVIVAIHSHEHKH